MAGADQLVAQLRQPVWVFDIDRKRVAWANPAALALWSSPSLAELTARDMGADMSASVAARLAQYQSDFIGHGASFNEQWTLYPAGRPVSLDVTFSGYRLPDGRMAMMCEGRPLGSERPESLRSVEALLHTPVMITLYTPEGEPVYRNPAARTSVPELRTTLAERFPQPDALPRLTDPLATRGAATLTLQARTTQGARWHEVSVQRCVDAVSGEAALLVSEVDVTRLKESEAQARFLAAHDVLTGLPNRSQVKQCFAEATSALRTRGQQAALILIDLDHFKKVNDTLGHAVGDELLIEVASRLRQSVRRGDLASRFGGDEFLLLVLSSDIRAEVDRIDTRIRDAVAQPLWVGNTQVQVTATLGVSLYPEHGSDFETLLQHADLAMYAAKEGGRNALAYFEHDMGESFRQRTALEADLRGACERREFEVHYQPRVDVTSNRIVGAEALVRWRHPRRGLVPPGEFIAVCESTGLICEVGRQVLANVVEQLRRWSEAGLALPVSVNLSPREFADPGLAERVGATLAEAGCAPELLQMEITESMLLGGEERPLTTLHALRELGVSIALDDFGTGYSNLAYLQRFPIGTLKIDRSFIQAVGDDQRLAELIVQLCRVMRLDAVAEGVETPEQLAWIRERGVAQYQGFLFARPMPAGEFESMLRAQAGRAASG
ncbi:MAG: EAL domain-containing protein [Rubrivivax sp.]|nr:EAL domain-containing protein [Rubrivivax sp.]